MGLVDGERRAVLGVEEQNYDQKLSAIDYQLKERVVLPLMPPASQLGTSSAYTCEARSYGGTRRPLFFQRSLRSTELSDKQLAPVPNLLPEKAIQSIEIIKCIAARLQRFL